MLKYTPRRYNVVTAADVDAIIEEKFGRSYNCRRTEELFYGDSQVFVIDETPLSIVERDDIEAWAREEHSVEPGVVMLLSYLNQSDGSVYVGDYILEA